MKWIVTLLTSGTLSIMSQAQPAALSPAQTYQQQAAQAQSLYERHSYAEAAAILEKLSADPQIAGLPEWVNGLYNLACYEALAGRPAQALATLEQEISFGGVVPVDGLREDPDLAALRTDSKFQELVTHLTKEYALWTDDVAIATPYKPVLTEDEKVAGLSKFWSEARFNFAFFGRLPDLDWDRSYMEYLPQVRAAQTTADYYRVMIRFAALLRDGHTGVIPPDEIGSNSDGDVGFGVQLVEDKVVVTSIYDPALAKLGIDVGVELVFIDGRPVREYAESAVAPYINGFTVQDRNAKIYGYQLLRGPKTTPVQLTIRKPNGDTKTVSVHRYCEATSKCTWPTQDEPVQFKMLTGNIAYFAVNEFEDDLGAKALRDNFAEISQAKGLIVDVRKNGGGSSNNGFAILSMLTNKSFQTLSWRTLDYKPIYRASGGAPGWWKGSANEVSPDSTHYFSKPVIVLTGAQTYSAAEDFVVAFDAMHRGKLVGEPTGGSTGQPLMFKLPGGGSARVCTKDDAYPDGRTFEGIGVVPQVKVSPTVSDVRAGRDAVLERAIEMLK